MRAPWLLRSGWAPPVAICVMMAVAHIFDFDTALVLLGVPIAVILSQSDDRRSPRWTK